MRSAPLIALLNICFPLFAASATFVCVICALQTALDIAKKQGADAVVAFLTEFSAAAKEGEAAEKKTAEEEAAAEKKKAEEEAAAKKKKEEEEAAAEKKKAEEDDGMINAARVGELAEVQRLVGRGANVNAKDKEVCSRLNT